MQTAEIRRRFLAPLRAARPPRGAVGVAARTTTPTCCSSTPAWCRSSRTSSARRRRRGRVRPACRSACARTTSRRSARPPGTARSSRCAATSRFGDYFKERRHRARLGPGHPVAVRRRLRLRRVPTLYASVYHDDDEAIALWKQVAGLPDDRIVRLGMKDNYWSMGVPGPCGPCSEILIDRGPEFGADGDSRRPATATWSSGTSCSCRTSAARAAPRRTTRSSATCRPRTSTPAWVSSGSRTCCRASTTCTRSTRSRPVIAAREELSGRRYGADPGRRRRGCGSSPTTSAARLMLIADGVTPGNEGRGYVLRRLLRRAVRSMRLLGVDEPTLPALLPVAQAKMVAVVPRAGGRLRPDRQIAYAEEEAFRAHAARRHPDLRHRGRADPGARRATSCPATEAFQLHDTYGFPIDLTLEMAAEQGLDGRRGGLPRADGRAARAGQGRLAGREGPATSTPAPTARSSTGSGSRCSSPAFDEVVSEARRRRLLVGADGVRAVPRGEGDEVEVVLDRTPFYAEGGRPAGRPRRARAGRRRPRSRSSTCSAARPAWSCTGCGCSRASW